MKSSVLESPFKAAACNVVHLQQEWSIVVLIYYNLSGPIIERSIDLYPHLLRLHLNRGELRNNNTDAFDDIGSIYMSS